MKRTVGGEKKVGILTFHWADDFGAMLQAYGLKRAIETLNFKTEIIPYSNRNLSGRYWLFRWVGARSEDDKGVYGNTGSISGYWDYRIIKQNLKNLPLFLKRRQKMRSFRHKYLTRKHWRKNIPFLKLKEYDAFVIGSDQVWNPEITVGVDRMYLGDFPKKQNAKTIAYAASIGKEVLDSCDGEKIGTLIDKNFDIVSVREVSSILFLKEHCAREITDMPDPTLLCDSSVWTELTHCPGMDGEIVLVYSTEANKELNDFADSLCSKYGVKLVNARNLAIGPAEFLWLVKNAKFVVTNSFHCSVFSILFHKDFYVFAHSNKNARLEDLLDKTGLNDRLGDSFADGCALPEPNWLAVEERLMELRNRGLEYLKTV